MAKKGNGHRSFEELALEKFDEMSGHLERMSQQLAENSPRNLSEE